MLNTKKREGDSIRNIDSSDVRKNNPRHFQSDIVSYNKWNVLDDWLSEDTNCDFFDMLGTSSQKEHHNGSKKELPKKVNNSTKSYAEQVKSPNKNKLERRVILNNSQDNISKNDRGQINTNNDACNSSDRASINNDNGNAKSHGNGLRKGNDINIGKDPKSSGTDSLPNNFNDPFLYNILNKIKKFTKTSPVMSFDYWISFMIDIFEFIGQCFDIAE